MKTLTSAPPNTGFSTRGWVLGSRFSTRLGTRGWFGFLERTLTSLGYRRCLVAGYDSKHTVTM